MYSFAMGFALENILARELPITRRAAKPSKESKGISLPSSETPGSAEIDMIEPVGEGDHVLGVVDAPVTLVEYGNYTCPRCAEAQPVVEQLRLRFGNQLRLVFRHFMETKDSGCELAAEAAEAAGARGEFWTMHNRLLQSQHLIEPGFLTWQAAAVGLDVSSFQRELNLHIYAHRIHSHDALARRSGVRHAPTFFINGRRHNGHYDLNTLSQAVKNALYLRSPMARV